MNSLVSIIVPIYRIEKHLGICIESIIKQTYSNLEIILVDDGSDDRCPDICDLYAKKDNRIMVIHKSNGGLVSARKAGLKSSSGEYIAYVDGDDWIESDYIERMISDMVLSNADVVCAGQSRDLFNESVRLYNSVSVGIYRDDDLDRLKTHLISNGDFYRPGISTYVWNKLFKRSCIYDYQMKVNDEISIGEDAAVTYPVIMNCKCVFVNDCTSYHYRQREDSMLKKSNSFSKESKSLKHLYDYLLSLSELSDAYEIKEQIIDYVLSIYLIRSGGILPNEKSYSFFGVNYQDKRVVIYSAGTFGQQLVNRIREYDYCKIVKWIDDDFWEYRRCCLDVDSVESVGSLESTEYDYVLIATVDCRIAETIKRRLSSFGIDSSKLLYVDCPKNIREEQIQKYLN